MPFYQKDSLFNQTNKIELIYAGCPSRGRDTINNAIKGILSLDKELQDKIHLIIAGADPKVFIKNGLSKKEYEASLSFCDYIGKVSHERIEELYKTARFSLYLKPAKKRFSKAGFPTKVTESLAYGTPVIANLSGDVGLFLNKNNSVIIKDDSSTSFADGIKHILDSDINDEYSKMSKTARMTAENELSLEKYKSIIDNYFNN